MQDQNLVSVVITTRNRADLLPRAIRSVLEQTWPDLELIVVDDASDIPVTLTTTDPRVRLLRNETARGCADARNVGFQAPRGRFLCMLDDDDWYLPEKLESQARYLLDHPGTGMVFSRVVVRDAAGQDRHYLGLNHVHSAEINLMAFNVIHPASALVRREVYEQIRFEPTIRKYEDTLFFNRVCFTCETAFLPMDVAVWMQDGRPDQLTRVFHERNFINFRIVCEGLKEILRSHPKARRRYYGRLAVQAARCKRFGEATLAGMRALGVAPV